MTNTRKILAGVAVAAGLAAGTAIVYAAPPAGFGPGYGPCAFYGAGPGSGAMGPGMMGGGYGPGMMGPGRGMMGGGYGPGPSAGPAVNLEERVDARLSFLKNEVKITPDQQAAWDAYAAQAKARAAAMQAFRDQPTAAAQTATERIEQRADRARLHAEQMKTASDAVKNLYAALTPEQKAVADRHFGGPQFAQRGPRGYGRWN